MISYLGEIAYGVQKHGGWLARVVYNIWFDRVVYNIK